jgi:uncharacterized protein
MPVDAQAITFNKIDLLLLADRAILWPERRTLVVADVHLGKDASFRRAGLPVPAGNSSKDLARLDVLLRETGATRLIVLGDLVHSRTSHQVELATAFSAWRSTHPEIDILLIRGNHDLRAGPTPPDWRITEVREPFEEGPIMLAHHAQPTYRPQLCGHVHPVVAVRDFDRSFASLPCFVVDANLLTLPAFGSFTGGFKVARSPDRKIFATTGSAVTRVRR